MSCAIPDCEGAVVNKLSGYCGKHHMRYWKYGNPYYTKNREWGTGRLREDGYILLTKDGRKVLEHVWKAEQALGKRLPKGAEVHHVNGNKSDNRNANLVVCPNRAYHKLIERRTKELGYKL